MIDKYYFINSIPKLELCYENILHNKVYSDLYIAIPDGIKILLWFTYYKNKNICVILYLNKYNKITDVKNIILSYDNTLSYGTIIYGTYFNSNNTNYITCENIYMYKGTDVNNLKYIEKLNILKSIFSKELNQIVYTNNSPIIGLPFITSNLNEIYKNIKILNYRVKAISFQNLSDSKNIGMIYNKLEINKECIFKINATLQDDIYLLYDLDGFYGYAGIFDYKTSVMMNNYFRKIKENANLDFLEMSDAEEEFENIEKDKFVNLKKNIIMKCKYNKKFRKWQPIQIVENEKYQLLNKSQIKNLELK